MYKKFKRCVKSKEAVILSLLKGFTKWLETYRNVWAWRYLVHERILIKKDNPHIVVEVVVVWDLVVGSFSLLHSWASFGVSADLHFRVEIIQWTYIKKRFDIQCIMLIVFCLHYPTDETFIYRLSRTKISY